MLSSSGYLSRQSGRSIFPRRDTFHARNLTWQHPTRSTRQTFFYLMTSFLVEERFTKYALTFVDVASRYKEAEPLTSKDSAEVEKAFQSIYKRSTLTWLQMLKIDPDCEFMGGVTKEMEKHKTYIRRGRTEIHRDQEIVDLFNRTLQSACLAISMPWRRFCMRASGQLSG